MCKRIAIIDKGKIISEGEIKKLKKELKFPDIIHLYLSNYTKLKFLEKMGGVVSYRVNDGVFIQADSGLKTVKRIEKILKSKNVKIIDVEIRKATLEEVFLKIIGQKEAEEVF